MTYSAKTLAKVIKMLKSLLNYFLSLPYESLKLHISKGNKKIGLVHNFSMAPILTCINCGLCKNMCYDVKANLLYKNVRIARAENTALMMKNMDKTFEQIDNYISRKRAHKAFRWHVSGDIISFEYFCHMVEIAKRHPDWRFWTYTKAYKYVNAFCYTYGRDAIPENFSIMFSVWKGLKCENPFGFAVFTCKEDGVEVPEDSTLCPGDCQVCLDTKTGCPYGKNKHCLPH